MKLPMSAITCPDDFRVSIQASGFHYCEPCNDSGPYTSYELGFPSKEDALIQEYAETPESPTGTVYGYVPRDVVIKLLKKHGLEDPDAILALI